jgi:hypothetical protein
MRKLLPSMTAVSAWWSTRLPVAMIALVMPAS